MSLKPPSPAVVLSKFRLNYTDAMRNDFGQLIGVEDVLKEYRSHWDSANEHIVKRLEEINATLPKRAQLSQAMISLLIKDLQP